MKIQLEMRDGITCDVNGVVTLSKCVDMREFWVTFEVEGTKFVLKADQLKAAVEALEHG